MNPFEALVIELKADSNYLPAYAAALAWLLPYWSAEWDDEPAAYMNRYAPILDKVRALYPSPLRDEMEKFVHARFDQWRGEPFTPEEE